MTHIAFLQAFEDFRNAGCPPNPSLLYKIGSTALAAANERVEHPARLVLAYIHEIAVGSAARVEDAPVYLYGAWQGYAELFDQLSALIAKLDGHDTADLLAAPVRSHRYMAVADAAPPRY